MKNIIETSHIIIHSLVLLHFYKLPNVFKNVYFLSDGLIVLHHLFYYPIKNRFHLIMIYIHLGIHLQAVLYLVLQQESQFFNFHRVFALADGSNYTNSITDNLYNLGTIQDIITH